MKFNILSDCVLLWALVELCAYIFFLIRKKGEINNYNAVNVYINRLIFFLKKGIHKEKLFQEIYLSLPKCRNNKTIRTYLIKAIRCGSVYEGIDYIEDVIGCEPIRKLHNLIKGEYVNERDLKEIITTDIELWQNSRRNQLKTVFTMKTKLIAQEILLIVANFMLYIRTKNDISFVIVVVVNTIGAILFILLEYESIHVIQLCYEGNLAYLKMLKRKSHPPTVSFTKLFQMVGGMGIVANTAMLAVRFLDEAI